MKILRNFSIFLLITTVAAGWVVLTDRSPDNFTLQILDIGQGDAILIQTPEDIRILIDGGPGDTVLSQLGKSLPFYDRRLDLVILTHPDADHVEGLVSVLSRYRVGIFLWTETKRQTPAFLALESLLDKHKVSVGKILAGDRIKTSDGLLAYVLWPLSGTQSNKTNESSIVTQINFKNYTFLLAGDVGEVSEYKMITMIKSEYLKSSVLKVGHHGSRYSSSPAFLDAVKPKVSVISAGEGNFYGHPTEEVLRRLESAGSQILRTDLDGTVKFIVTDKGLIVKSAK